MQEDRAFPVANERQGRTPPRRIAIRTFPDCLLNKKPLRKPDSGEIVIPAACVRVAGDVQGRYIVRMIRELANPTRFMSLSGTLLPWVGGLAAILLGVGLYMVW